MTTQLGTIAINSTCRDYEDLPERALMNHLLFGTRARHYRLEDVVSLDGRGAVTLHHPATLNGSTALTPGDAVTLDHAYELDDAPGFERFLFVTSDAPLDVATVLEAAHVLARQPSEARTRPLPLPETLVQTSFTLEKVP